MSRKALITGITGQDGAYLAKFLLNKGYEVYGIYRRLSSPNFWRLECLEIFDKVNLISADLIDGMSIIEALKIAKPDEVYNLAAQSFVETSFNQPVATGQITGLAVTRLLEAIRHVDPEIKFYQASSSEMFGNGIQRCAKLDEQSPFMPQSPYAAAKLYGHHIVKVYRSAYRIFACSGILFNHESPLRGLEFVTRKISNAVAKIAMNMMDELYLGNLVAERDWGYAPEYVEAMWMMLQKKKPEDFVIATGDAHSVKEFAEKAFSEVDLNWEEHVKVDKRFLRPLDVNLLSGDYSKAKKELGWKPKVRFDDLVKIMVGEDLNRWQKWQNGERFPWDAPGYWSETRILNRSLKA